MINEIIHHQQFQKLESAWRGLHYLVNNTETDEMLQLRVMNISKQELHRTLKWYKGAAWDQSPIFKRLYEEEFGTLGGKPYGAIVGDYYFDHSAPDVELLTELSKVSAAAHAPFISAAVALLIEFYPDAAPDEIEQTIETSSLEIDPLNPDYAGQLGAGRLDLSNAIDCSGRE